MQRLFWLKQIKWGIIWGKQAECIKTELAITGFEFKGCITLDQHKISVPGFRGCRDTTARHMEIGHIMLSELLLALNMDRISLLFLAINGE
jgi:hypothetical protein